MINWYAEYPDTGYYAYSTMLLRDSTMVPLLLYWFGILSGVCTKIESRDSTATNYLFLINLNTTSAMAISSSIQHTSDSMHSR